MYPDRLGVTNGVVGGAAALPTCPDTCAHTRPARHGRTATAAENLRRTTPLQTVVGSGTQIRRGLGKATIVDEYLKRYTYARLIRPEIALVDRKCRRHKSTSLKNAYLNACEPTMRHVLHTIYSGGNAHISPHSIVLFLHSLSSRAFRVL